MVGDRATVGVSARNPPSILGGGNTLGSDAAIAAEDARINEKIRARSVRLIGSGGEQLGVKPTPDALTIARSEGLDLVEVAPTADPPVCRIMDFGKYRYEQDQKRKESRKKTSNVVIKEMKFRPKIDGHDYTTKMKHVERFLQEGSKVKLTIMFRGREMAHPELGRKILERVAVDVQEYAVVESAPKQDGRNMVMVLNALRKPSTAKKPKPAPGEASLDGSEGHPTPAVPAAAIPTSAFAAVGPVSNGTKPTPLPVAPTAAASATATSVIDPGPETAPAATETVTPAPEAAQEASTEAAAS